MHRSMKSLLWVVALLAPISAAIAGTEFSYRSDSTLRWHSEGRYLHLATAKDGGVKVLAVTPASLWGLTEGDEILEADGQPVRDVAALMDRLRAHDATPMSLKVRQGRIEKAVTLAAQAHELVSAPAPKSPAAPESPASPAALADTSHSRFVYQTDSSLRWRSDGQRLQLVTASGGGVNVVALTPASLWGLAQGDVIVEADGQPVHDVAGLLNRLRAHGASPMPVKVRRDGAEHSVMLAEQARSGLLPTAPPPAPPPPAPPAAPVPPGG
ncbi:PDZ domain-containing protein [Dyella sp. Tek66A03]|uniref:PDZ domain-containing protein n=1 Tax=Dyella sp. Tek66A03 TaxID=3458298 RepID=UPI00403E91A4